MPPPFDPTGDPNHRTGPGGVIQIDPSQLPPDPPYDPTANWWWRVYHRETPWADFMRGYVYPTGNNQGSSGFDGDFSSDASQGGGWQKVARYGMDNPIWVNGMAFAGQHPDWALWCQQHPGQDGCPNNLGSGNVIYGPGVDPNTGKPSDMPLDKNLLSGGTQNNYLEFANGHNNVFQGRPDLVQKALEDAITNAQDLLRKKLADVEKQLEQCFDGPNGSAFDGLFTCLQSLSDPGFAPILMSHISTDNLQDIYPGVDALTTSYNDGAFGTDSIVFDLDKIYKDAGYKNNKDVGRMKIFYDTLNRDMLHEMMHYCSYGNAYDQGTPHVNELDAAVLCQIFGFSTYPDPTDPTQSAIGQQNYNDNIKNQGGNYFSLDPNSEPPGKITCLGASGVPTGIGLNIPIKGK